MARPQKNNADYFSHDSSMRNDMKIKALRRKYGMDGYGLYCMILEIVAASDHFEYAISEDDHIAWEMFAGDVDIETEHLREIISYMSSLGLLHYEGGLIYSDGLKKRLQGVVQKRDEIRAYRNSQKDSRKGVMSDENDDKPPETGVCATQTMVCDPQMQQSKVKETKVNEIKEKETIQVPVRVFSFLKDFWEPYPKKTNQLIAEDLFCNLGAHEVSDLMVRLPQFIDYWGTIEVRFVPAPDKFLSLKKWREPVPAYKKNTPAVPRSKPPEIPEPPNGKEDHPKIWEYFLSLDEKYRAQIEKIASDKYAHLELRNANPLIKNAIIIAIRPEYEEHQSQ